VGLAQQLVLQAVLVVVLELLHPLYTPHEAALELHPL
jgi:hypothetical protein